MIKDGDYAGILRVFNYKPMLSECPVARLLGFSSKDDYISGVLWRLKGHDDVANRLRDAVKHCFGIYGEGMPPLVESKPAQPQGAATQKDKPSSAHQPQEPRQQPRQRLKPGRGAERRKWKKKHSKNNSGDDRR